MAGFEISVESPLKGAERISRSLGVYAGKVSITSYSQTLVECTAITKYFVPTNAVTTGYKDGVISCQIDGPSSGGYIVRWDYTTGGFRCYAPYAGTTPTGTWSMGSGTSSGLTAVYFLSASGIHASAVPGVVPLTCTALVPAVAGQAAANVAVGTFGFVAVGFVRG